MSDFGAFLGKIAGKVANAANSDRKLKCYGCDEITGHISISYADAFKAHGGDNVFFATVGVAFDLVPAAYPITIGNPYACNDCKRLRFEGGILSNEANKKCYYL
ncbi:hypothetical protein [Anabaena sp. AL93]|jgi:hypothetical protein|uniref:hypothetical protein n=1 Tax=Anabaena sp. AL93 TaxID=1678133 RepID=UPI0007FFB542|nr:hypothetical protein [Anabaena sp. AL93]OBQ19670.1 MAG: hypothetical protein AN486_08930 [Anabaena sp. AL93]